MGELVGLLEPLEKMTRHFSGSAYVTLSWVYPMVLNCIRELGDVKPRYQIAIDAKKVIEKGLLDRWYNIVGDPARIAMMLDPRFKSMSLTGDDVETHFTRLRTLYMSERQLMPKESDAANKPAGVHSNFFHPSLRNAVPQNDDEFLRYLNEDEIDLFVPDPNNPQKQIPNDPLAWWAKRKGKFKTLERLARKYLAIPASSVPSESLFSTAGRVANRNTNLGDAALNACLLVNRNWHFVMSVDPADYEPLAANRDAVCSVFPSLFFFLSGRY